MSVWIAERATARGPSFHVRYRRGGRQAHAGAYRHRGRAQARAGQVEQLLAYGLDPACELGRSPAVLLGELDGPDPVRPLLVLCAAVAAADRAGDHQVARHLANRILNRSEEGDEG